MSAFKRIHIAHHRLADEIYRQILDAISSGKIAPQERIVQERLANEMQVSRTPVREALLRLEQEGVLALSGRSGFVIRSISQDEVREIYQVRQAIEGYCARLLCERCDPDCYAQLHTLIAEEENLRDHSAKSYFHANRNIHRGIVMLANNRYMLELFDGVWNRGSSFRIFSAIEDIDLSKSLGEHDSLIDAIASGNPDHAAAAMRAHIVDGLELQLKHLS